MKKKKSTKIGTKLLAGFLIVAVIAGAIGLWSINLLISMERENEEMFQNYGNSQGYLGYVMADFQKERVYLREIDLNPDIENVAAVKKDFDVADAHMMEQLAAFKASCTTEENIALYDTLIEKVEAWRTFTDQLFEMNLAGDNESVAAIKTKDSTKKIVTDVTEGIDAAMASNVGSATEKIQAQKEAVYNDQMILIIVVAGAVAAALLFGVLLSRKISRPVIKIAESAKKLADGNMEITLDINSTDEVGILAEAFTECDRLGNQTDPGRQYAVGCGGCRKFRKAGGR